MQKLTFKKSELLRKIRANRNAHKAIVAEAWAGYKAEALSRLRKALESLDAGELGQVSIHVVAPEDHSKEYEAAISMLENCLQDDIEIDVREYSQLVLDEWGWNASFLDNNAQYSKTARVMLAQSGR